MSTSYVRDSANAKLSDHNDNGVWLSVADPTLEDAAGGTYTFPLADPSPAVVKVYELPWSSRSQTYTFGVKHPLAALNAWNYVLRVVESDDLPSAAGGAPAYADYMAVACLPPSTPSLTISRSVATLSAHEAIHSTKRRYLFFVIESMGVGGSPDSDITFSVLSYDAYRHDPMRYPLTA